MRDDSRHRCKAAEVVRHDGRHEPREKERGSGLLTPVGKPLIGGWGGDWGRRMKGVGGVGRIAAVRWPGPCRAKLQNCQQQDISGSHPVYD
jgi:hypothetical protein